MNKSKLPVLRICKIINNAFRCLVKSFNTSHLYKQRTIMHTTNLKLLFSTLFCFSLLFFSSCDDTSDNVDSKNIVELAQETSNLSSLVAALTDSRHTTDFAGLLSGSTAYTVFAPTNDAFAKIDSKTLNSLLEEKNKKALANILTYHVIPGKITASDVVAALKKGGGMVELKALNGQTLSVIEKDGKIWLKDSNGKFSEIVATDVMGSNGVIHVISSVVMPK